MKYQYFLSYKSEDIELVRNVCDWLYAENIPVWLNEYNIKHTNQNQFQEFINEGIDQSEYGVLFITEEYAGSPYCLIEVERLLRRLPVERIIPIVLEKPERFKRLYPEIPLPLEKATRDTHAILDILKTKSNLNTKNENLFEPIKSKVDWHVIEAGFKFNPYDLQVDLASKFTHTKRFDINRATGTKKEEYHIFTAHKKKVQLLFDYDFYESDYAEVVECRIKQGDGVRIMDVEQNERKRLIEEMEKYDDEVKASYQRILKSYALKNISSQDVEEIGVHMISTIEQGENYKHRMYTFRIDKLNRTFRMIKLVLPHPIHRRAYLVRFIFSCEGSRDEFYYYVPLYQKILRSFSWLRESDVLSDEELSQAQDLFTRRGVIS